MRTPLVSAQRTDPARPAALGRWSKSRRRSQRGHNLRPGATARAAL